jgi:hypothetical protein
MKKDVAFGLPQGYTLRMTNTTTTATMFRATQNFTVTYPYNNHATEIAKGDTIRNTENLCIANGFFFWFERVGAGQITQLTNPLPVKFIKKI